MTGKKAIVWGFILTFGSIALIWLMSLITVAKV